MRRTHCSGCGYDDLRTFLDLGVSPIADAYTDTPFAPVEAHPLQLAVCAGCWLVQLLEVVDHKTLFGTGYSFYSSASPPLSEYHARYASDILDKYRASALQLTVEIGCNDGDMLRHFADAGCPTVGVDPAGGPAAVARTRGIPVIEAPFTAAVAEQIKSDSGSAGVIVANHVLAHVDDVGETLDGISRLVAKNGVAFVEVQYLPDLLVNNAFDLVYHEHRNFFSLSSLEKAAGRWGLHVTDAQLTNRQAGSLRVELRRVRRDNPNVDALRTSEYWLTDWSAYGGFQGRIERVRARLLGLLRAEAEAGHNVVGYGAPAKATTLLNFCGIGDDMLLHVTDTTAAKHDRFIPGTGLVIRQPTYEPSAVDTFLLLAWNYLPQIMRNHSEFTARGGRWIAPIPVPTLI